MSQSGHRTISPENDIRDDVLPYMTEQRYKMASTNSPNEQDLLQQPVLQYPKNVRMRSPSTSAYDTYLAYDTQTPRKTSSQYASSPVSPLVNAPRWATYESDTPTYAMAWSYSTEMPYRLALGTFSEDSHNKLQIISKAGDRRYERIAMADTLYPISKISWEPRTSRSSRGYDLLASVGDYLKLWELHEADNALKYRARLYNAKTDHAAPLTSFDWNESDPSLIVTSSIDTTCTVWNVETQQAKTQLIAHDREVYDVAFASGSVNVFASVGADGSVRMFDLRSLEHSTIVYETMPSYSGPSSGSSGAAPIFNGKGTPSTLSTSPPPPPASSSSTSSAIPSKPKAPAPGSPPPLLRLAFNKLDSNLLATFSANSSLIQVLDVRVPGVPTFELRAHSSNVNAIQWAPTHKSYLASASDDGQVLIWDIQSKDKEKDIAIPSSSSTSTSSRKKSAGTNKSLEPILAYTAESEVYQLAWSTGAPEWIAVGLGKNVRMLSFD